jgi:hypothetical protein
MQRAIPTGSPVLATVNDSFLLDFLPTRSTSPTSPAPPSSALADPRRTLWFHTETAITLRSYDQFEELGRSRGHLYDYGKMFFLDLAISCGDPQPPNASNNLDGTPPVGYP